MIKVVAQEVELNLTFDQVLALMGQLQPQEMYGIKVVSVSDFLKQLGRK